MRKIFLVCGFSQEIIPKGCKRFKKSESTIFGEVSLCMPKIFLLDGVRISPFSFE